MKFCWQRNWVCGGHLCELWNYDRSQFSPGNFKNCHSSPEQEGVSKEALATSCNGTSPPVWLLLYNQDQPPPKASPQPRGERHGCVGLWGTAARRRQELCHSVVFITSSRFKHRLITPWELFTSLILITKQKEAVLHSEMWLTRSSLAFHGTGICVRGLISQPGFHAWMNTAASILLRVRKRLLQLPKLNIRFLSSSYQGLLACINMRNPPLDVDRN